MRCPDINRPASQGGAALILALLIFAISAALIVAMTGQFERLYQRAGNIFIAGQTRAYLHGAEGLATLALLVDHDQDKDTEDPRDTLDEIWAQPPAAPYTLDEGWMEGRLEDLQGRFNLNLLGEAAEPTDGELRPTPAEAQFIRLLLAVGEPEISEFQARAIAQAVSDWVDTDSATRPDGAEDDYYGSLTPAYRTANRPMASVSELRAVKGVTPELYAALEPWVTVWPQKGGKLNINTAPAMVLRSLGADGSLRPLSMDEAQSLVNYRGCGGFASIDDLLSQPVFSYTDEQKNEVNALLGMQSGYFLLRAQAEVAGRHARLYSVLQRENRQVSVLSRTVDARLDPKLLERENLCGT